jgi:hypothetical protein
VVAAKARHLQRIADDAAGFFGQVLQVRVHVVVRHHHRVLLLQQAADFVLQRRALAWRRLHRHTRPGVAVAQPAAFGLLVIDFG